MASPLRMAAIVVAFVVAYLFLDQVSYIYAFKKFNITPWNPPVGLSLAALLLLGPRFALVIVCARLVGDFFLRDMPAPLLVSVLGAVVVVVGYTLGAQLLRHWMRINLDLPRSRDLLGLFGISLLCALVVAMVYVTLLTVTDLLPWDAFYRAVTRRWVGDAIGIVTVTPLLLVHGRRFLVERTAAPKPRATDLEAFGEALGQAGSILLVLWMIFGIDWYDHDNPSAEFQFFYMLFLPLIWIAVRSGLYGVTLGVLGTQIGLIVAIRTLGDYSGTTVTALQMLMITLAITSLLLGTVVSERRRTEALLRDSEARIQTLVRMAPDGIVTVDPDGQIESLNPAAERLFGYAAGELVGKPIDRILPRLDDGRTFPFAGGEVDARCKNGALVPVDLTVSEAALAGRRLFIGMVRDISQRKQIEARLNQKQTELAHVSRLSLMGEMATALAHEINQPLSAIVNYTRVCQMLLDGSRADAARVDMARVDMERLRTTMDKAVHQADRAGEIIRRLREFLGKGETQLSIVSIDRIMEEVIGLSRAGAVQHAIVLRAELDGPLPPLLVDNIQIEQVILNLVRNAMDALTQTGVARREIVLSARRSGQDHIQVTVRDNGPGIAEDIADQLFTPFATTKSTGMGLGLSISRSIVEAHGGRLWTEAGQVEGAVFHFTLPIAPAMDESHA